MNRIFSSLNATLAQGLARMGLCALPLVAISLTVMAAPPAQTATETAAPALASYTTKAGDTIERVMKNAMPDSPLNPQVLRKALADANPQVVNGKPGQKFKTGSVIQLPDHGVLVRNTLEAFAPAGSEASYRSGYSASDPASRRHWVRYP